MKKANENNNPAKAGPGKKKVKKQKVRVKVVWVQDTEPLVVNFKDDAPYIGGLLFKVYPGTLNRSGSRKNDIQIAVCTVNLSKTGADGIRGGPDPDVDPFPPPPPRGPSGKRT